MTPNRPTTTSPLKTVPLMRSSFPVDGASPAVRILPLLVPTRSASGDAFVALRYWDIIVDNVWMRGIAFQVRICKKQTIEDIDFVGKALSLDWKCLKILIFHLSFASRYCLKGHCGSGTQWQPKEMVHFWSLRVWPPPYLIVYNNYLQ